MNEEITEETPPNDLATIDSPIMLRDEPVISQMEAAATELELNVLRKFDQHGSPHSEATALNLDIDSQATDAPANSLGA